MSIPSGPCVSCPDGVFLRGGSQAAGEQRGPAPNLLDITRQEGVEPSLPADSTIGRKQESWRQIQELCGPLEGERRRIRAYGSVQCTLIVGSKEEPYHMLKGKAELTPVLGTSLLNCNEGTLG